MRGKIVLGNKFFVEYVFNLYVLSIFYSKKPKSLSLFRLRITRIQKSGLLTVLLLDFGVYLCGGCFGQTETPKTRHLC